ncbi:hypothetical protein B2G51_05855 [Leptospira santarosai]|nr:hypothetical protein B2G51_05855 [Leptospira santarosai]OLY59392.1 hypothetical protein BV917_15545 [Leptospira santarosai serovar Guaricura]ONF86330.1 hypothetical protein BWD13_11065 [Leptospira santarosai serovar Grippotyphosa]
MREIWHIYYSHQARCEYKKNLSPTEKTAESILENFVSKRSLSAKSRQSITQTSIGAQHRSRNNNYIFIY